MPLTLDERLSEAQFRLRSDYGLYDLSDAVAEARNKLNIIHEHAFEFMGVFYHYTDYPLPGSGAYGVIYEDAFFCKTCLKTEYRNPRQISNSYERRIDGTFPRVGDHNRARF